MSLRAEYTKALDAWDTREPLRWQLPAPPPSGLSETLSEVMRESTKWLPEEDESRLTDFTRLRAALSWIVTCHPNSPAAQCSLEHFFAVESGFIRQHLALIFSFYQLHVDTLDLRRWSWCKAIRAMGPRLSLVTSFNYDLIAETILERYHEQLYRPTSEMMREPYASEVLVSKPHGSIDYGVDISADTDESYTLPRVSVMANTPVRLIPRDRLLHRRLESQLVVPTENSRFRRMQWNEGIAGLVGYRAKRARGAIIAGLSYDEADRAEIDEVLCALPPTASIYVANPAPSGAMMEAIHSRFATVRVSPRAPSATYISRI
jgi:hypothetical protein